MHMQNLLTRPEAAAYLNISPATLARWACTRTVNLPYLKVGRCARYRQTDLDAFVAANMTNLNTTLFNQYQGAL